MMMMMNDSELESMVSPHSVELIRGIIASLMNLIMNGSKKAGHADQSGSLVESTQLLADRLGERSPVTSCPIVLFFCIT